MIRRDFLKALSLAAGARGLSPRPLYAALLDSSSSTTDSAVPARPGAATTAATFALFQEPPATCRPMVRWWWNGDRVDAKELLRELDVLKAAGIGGVEINPIKFPDGADPLSTQPLLWLSEPWIDVLEVVLKGAKERQLTCDMIVGSGWPFGGEFLSRADQTQMVALGTRNLSGPARVTIARAELLAAVSPAFVSPWHDPLKQLIGLSLVPEELGSEHAVVNMDNQIGSEQILIDVPAGPHVLYSLVKLTGFMAVINGAPGANGPVLNHFNADAVRRYLDHLSGRLTARLGSLHPYLRAFFTDSIELEGANWCDDMPAEFRRRRGYDLLPWLPFILFKVGEMGNAVSGQYGAHFAPDFHVRVEAARYDFETLRRELFGERFVHTFVEWCSSLGVKSRMQAYGTECDVMSASQMLDIPECETWIRSEQIEAFGTGDYSTGRSYTMINKFVSSAAHLANKQLISCEEMTNTDDPFGTSLNRVKVAGDQSILAGVTQSVLHGFNYSPPSAPFPGWVRYGTYFSERNTWWPFFRHWTDYKARLSYLFQQSVMQADVAILPPFADLAAKYGFQRDPFPQVVYPDYLFKLWEAIHANGSGCDYVTEDVLQQSRIERGQILYSHHTYKTLLLADVTSLHPRTMKALEQFAASGGTILLLGSAPGQAPGLLAAPETPAVAQASKQLLHNHPDRVAIVQVDAANLVSWYKNLQQHYALTPDVTLSNPVDFVSQVHYADAKRDLYFFSNYSADQIHHFTAAFNSMGDRQSWLWDATSGTRTAIPLHANHGPTELTLAPSESKLVVFESIPVSGTTADTAVLPALPPLNQLTTAADLSGPWQVEFAHVDGSHRTQTFATLTDPALTQALQAFAGTLTYTATLHSKAPQPLCWLDLGPLPHSVSELKVNTKPCGLRWYGQDHVYGLSNVLRIGANTIEIRVTTTLGDYMKTLTNNQTAKIWTENTPFYPQGMQGPVRLLQLT